MDDEKYFVGELINLESDLAEKTKFLFEDLMDNSDKRIQLGEFRLAEVNSLKDKLDLFLKIKPEQQHTELLSLISFWERTFREMKNVFEENDSNTSWMSSEYNNYQAQHVIVDEMIRTYYKSLKDE